MKRIHITGCPRSGTTLIMELMHTCFVCDAFCGHEVSIFEPVSGNPNIYFSKQPSDVKRIGPLLDADTNLHSITMIRDPRSVITSQHKNLPGIYFCNFRIWNECYQAAKKLLTNPRNLNVRYEDLVQTPDAVQDQIQELFPFLTKTRKFSEYHQIANPSADANAALGGVRKVSKDRILSWQKHLPRIKYEYIKHTEIADTLIKLGYESDRDWLTLLDDINSDKGNCRYSDNINLIKDLEHKIRTTIKTKRYINKLP